MFSLLFAHGCLLNFLIFRFFSCYFWGITSSFSTVGKSRIKKIKLYSSTGSKIFLATNPCTLETFVRFCASISVCSWLDCLYLLSTIHQWNSLHFNKAHWYHKLCHRFKLSTNYYPSFLSWSCWLSCYIYSPFVFTNGLYHCRNKCLCHCIHSIS